MIHGLRIHARPLALALACLMLGLVVLANWLASKYIVTVPFTDYQAPAGVFAIGLVLVVRDWLQQLVGLWRSLPVVFVAGGLSYLIGNAAGWTQLETIAVASLVAFTCSELVEAVVFTPIRRRNAPLGVLLSGTAGAALDSYVFLTIAFGSLAFFDGQLIAKMYVVAVGSVVTIFRRRIAPVAAADVAAADAIG